MPDITVDLMQPMLDRLQQIADKNSCSVQDVILHFLNYSIKTHDTAKTPEEIKEYLKQFEPSRPRLVIDREQIRAMVAKYAPPPSGEANG